MRKTRSDARRALAQRRKQGLRNDPRGHLFDIYRCAYGNWHFGHKVGQGRPILEALCGGCGKVFVYMNRPNEFCGKCRSAIKYAIESMREDQPSC